MEKQPLVNVVVCGFTPVAALFLNILSSLDQLFHICGYWDPTNSLKAFINNVDRIECSFDDLLKCANYNVIFLCFSPQIQYKLLTAFLKERRSLLNGSANSSLPIIVLLPPLSPCYDIPLLSDSVNTVGIAMPFRTIPAVSLLCHHLKNVNGFPTYDNNRTLPSLPHHWTLGVVHSFHARLNVSSLLLQNQYSWLCESGIMGGGLVNLYGAGLADLAFLLTGGLRIASVACLSRTFDPEICSSLGSIRRINAEDYVLLSAELESRFPDSRKPVVMLCISANLPQPPSFDKDLPSTGFSLSIELTGSDGRFVVPPTGDKIFWNRVNRVISTGDSISNGVCNGEDGLTSSSIKVGNHEPLMNGTLEHVETSSPVNPNKTTLKLSKFTGQFPAVQVYNIGDEEVAVICSQDTLKQTATSQSGLLGEAWAQWLSHLSISLHSSNEKHSLEFLAAPPEHWGYIQRVCKAIDKSARMRCWIDVATGERV